MRKSFAPPWLAIGALALLPLAATTRAPWSDGIEVGATAPEISDAIWYNHLGQAPTIASLRGRAVLIEFWATW